MVLAQRQLLSLYSFGKKDNSKMRRFGDPRFRSFDFTGLVKIAVAIKVYFETFVFMLITEFPE